MLCRTDSISERRSFPESVVESGNENTNEPNPAVAMATGPGGQALADSAG